MSLVPQLLHRDDALLLASCRDVFLQCWLAPGGVHHVRNMIEVHRRFVQEHPAHTTVALSHITQRGMAPPDEETRAAIADHSKIVRGVRASATVIDGTGFGAAMIRGVVSGLMLLGDRSAEHQVFSTPRAGLQYLLSRRSPSAGAIDLDELDGAYARLRSSASP